jgi:hypothetical protein
MEVLTNVLTKHLIIGDCNCYLSWNAETSSARTRRFHPARIGGIPGLLGHLDDLALSQIREFIALRKATAVAREHESNSVYSTLDSNEIRILKLHPGVCDSGFHGTLHVACIDFEYSKSHGITRFTNHAVSISHEKPVWYTALSYVWGAPSFDIPMRLDDKSVINITRSLASALCHLRSEKECVWLWIDQICIDQGNIQDKEQQIPLMGLIYSHASNTLIWLGDDGGDLPDVAFETLEKVHSCLQFNGQEVSPKEFERLLLPKPEAQEWREVKQLFRRPWFTRLWVIQEVVLSINPYVKCGKVEALWDDFAAWCLDLEVSGILRWLESDAEGHDLGFSGSLLSPLGCRTVNQLTSELHIFHTQNRSEREEKRLLGVLVSTRYAQATDPKDKVYGVLGIAAADITLKYSGDVSARQVYLEASLKALPDNIFRLLSCVDHEVPPSPSWVPDWSVPPVTESLGYRTSSEVLYRAGGPTLNPQTGRAYLIHVQLSSDHRTATLPGKIFDRIVTLGDVTKKPSLDIDDTAQGNRAWLSYVGIAKSSQSYPTGATIFDAFWQTLVAGKDGTNIAKAPSEYSEVFSLILDESTRMMPSLPGQVYSSRRQKGYFTLDSLRTRKPRDTLEDFRKAFDSALRNRRFAVTTKGYFALVPRGSKIGDEICVFQYGLVPFIVRPTRYGVAFELIGECYVHGIMHGEVMGREDTKLEPVTLV